MRRAFFALALLLSACTPNDPAVLDKRAVLERQAFWDNRDFDWYAFPIVGANQVISVKTSDTEGNLQFTCVPADNGTRFLLDADIDVVAVELKAPFRKGLRAGVVAAAGAGGEDEDAGLGHRKVGRGE